MRHTAEGWWLEEAGPREELPPLTGAERADVVVVGGGYAGMWTAWELSARGADVVLVEAGRCGHGPSGRNGGFVDNLWHAAPRVRERFGDAAALALGRASGESVRAIGDWCSAQGIEAWYRRAGQLVLSAAPAQDGAGAAVAAACAAIGAPEEARAISASEVRTRCASPVLRSGTFMPEAATVQPARLALGLRDALVARGVRVYEGSRVVRLAGARASTAPGGVVHAGAAVVAVGVAGIAAAPLRRRLTGASSHMVVTEPVPDVLESVGWTGGESITDGRALVHYFRTTPDGRIAFGWGGGRILPGARAHGEAEVAPVIVARVVEDLHRFFPGVRGRRVEHAWGGPIDASPSHLPTLTELPGGRAWAVFGFTGNGVGPSHLCGRVLARLALDDRDALTRLPIVEPPVLRVPPEPLRWVGGSLIRAGIERKERAEEAGRSPDPVSRAVAKVPALLGMHIGR